MKKQSITIEKRTYLVGDSIFMANGVCGRKITGIIIDELDSMVHMTSETGPSRMPTSALKHFYTREHIAVARKRRSHE